MERFQPKSKFAARLRELRENEGISAIELGRQLHWGINTIHYYESGRSQPTLPMLTALADHFGVTLDYLAGLSNVRKHGEYEKVVSQIHDMSDSHLETMRHIRELCDEQISKIESGENL